MAKLSLFMVAVVVTAGIAGAAEYHVAKNGSDSNPGSSAQPFLTIQKAATIMQPGDVCTVQEGTYREEVIPPRGGSSEAQRITYRAADGEKVYWKGSDRFTNWTLHAENTYAVSIPNAAFGAFNPYTVFVKEAWMGYGAGKFHRGQVFYEGEQYRSKTPSGFFPQYRTPFVMWRLPHFLPRAPSKSAASARMASINGCC